MSAISANRSHWSAWLGYCDPVLEGQILARGVEGPGAGKGQGFRVRGCALVEFEDKVVPSEAREGLAVDFEGAFTEQYSGRDSQRGEFLATLSNSSSGFMSRS